MEEMWDMYIPKILRRDSLLLKRYMEDAVVYYEDIRPAPIWSKP